MNVDFLDAKKHLDNGKTVSGVEITDQYFVWDDLYLGTFYQKLVSLGYTSEIEYSKLLERMNEHECSGEFIDNSRLQMAEISAFGMIMFDRLVRVEAENLSFSYVFDMHEELSLCLDYVTGENEKSSRARKYALAKHAKDPKQKEKILVRECWEEWQRQPHRYKGKAEFTRDMLDKYENLKSQPVIERWCRMWEREIITPPAK